MEMFSSRHCIPFNLVNFAETSRSKTYISLGRSVHDGNFKEWSTSISINSASRHVNLSVASLPEMLEYEIESLLSVPCPC